MSGGQGVTSSNLASPTSHHGGLSRLIRAAFNRRPGHPRQASVPGSWTQIGPTSPSTSLRRQGRPCDPGGDNGSSPPGLDGQPHAGEGAARRRRRVARNGSVIGSGRNRRPVRQPACRVCRGYCTRGDQGIEKGLPSIGDDLEAGESPAKGSLTGTPCLLPGGSSLMVMESWNEIRTFLASRWAMITFEQAAVGTFGEMRRVPSLRPQLHRSQLMGWTAFKVDWSVSGTRRNRHVFGQRDERLLATGLGGSELRSTWRTRSSCSTAVSCWPTSMTSSAATDGFDRGGVPEAAAGRRTGRTRSASAPVSIMSASVHPPASSTDPFEQLKGRI